MAKPFKNLVAKMSTEAQERVRVRGESMLKRLVVTDTIIEVEREHLELSLCNLRQIFPEGTSDLKILEEVLGKEEVPEKRPQELSPEILLKFAKEKKSFSTTDILEHFQVDKIKAAGSLATLSGRKLIRSIPGKDSHGNTRWMLTR
jgi:hypothetical protein